MKVFLSTYILFLSIISAAAQTSELEMTNARTIDPKRYEGIDGSPYLYDDWQLARVLDENGEYIDSVLVNYNGDTQQFEATDGSDKYIVLNENAHLRVEVLDQSTGEYQIFVRSADYRIESPYTLQHFVGNELQWHSTYKANLEERKLETPGESKTIKKFVKINDDYFFIQGNIESFKQKKKKVLKFLDQYYDATKTATELGVDVETEEGLVELLQALDG